jgi:NIMA (never in mitosis gene a)-related kinase
MIQIDHINEANEAQAEAKELRSLRHPLIVRYEDDFIHTQWSKVGETIHVCIVMERCSHDLREVIEDRQEQEDKIAEYLAETTVLRYFAQICSALSYCHHKLIMHRDVKPQNIFLDAAEDGDVRLGDFGLCRRTAQNAAPQSYSEGGTDTYMPPEVMLGSKIDGTKVDVWCTGLVLLECMSLKFLSERPGLLGALVINDKHEVEKLVADDVPEVR